MIGTLRFVLAFMVVLNHIWLPTANKLGAPAVVAFYTISGFLMAMVLSETYTGLGGLGRYLINRFLRIFPTYWLVALATATMLAVAPRSFANINSALRLPDSLGLWLRNLSLVDLIYSPTRLVPPSWSLTVECSFYIAMGLLLARTAPIALLWFAGSLGYTGYMVWNGAEFGDRYYPVAAASLFFSAGASIYHLREQLRGVRLDRNVAGLLLAVFCVSPLVVDALGGDRFMEGFYGAFLLFLILLIAASNNTVFFARPVDRYLGELAYPLFLSHYFAVGLVRFVLPITLPPFGFVEALLAAGAALGLSCMIVRHFDPMISRTRDLVRPLRAPARRDIPTTQSAAGGVG